MTGIVDRRKFLAAAGLTAVGAAAAGVGGELMFGKDFRRTTAAPAPGMTAPAAPAPPATMIPELKINPMKPLPTGDTLDSVSGISPFYTPNAEFYRVDTS